MHIIFIIFFTVFYSMAMQNNSHPFSYDLDLKIINNNSADEVTVCCHGYGDSNAFVDTVKSYNIFDHALLGFNFPDHHINDSCDHSSIAYGTIKEILPLLYMLKECVDTYNFSKINLYGFSAGGGAIINALGVLNTYIHSDELLNIGITKEIAEKILGRLQNGLVILECPLKSVREIIDLRGTSKNLALMAKNYDTNKMNPIDTIERLKNLNITVLLYFENPDEVIGNRDDELFINKIKNITSISLHVLTGSYGGHCAYHKNVWDKYKKLQ